MIIFCDFDGTLVNIQKKYKASSQFALNYIGRKEFPNNYWALKKTHVHEKNIFRYLNNVDFNTFNAKRIEVLENPEYLKLDSLFPNTKKALVLLKKQNYKIVLVSMRRNRQNLIKQLEQLKILDFFESILTPSKDYKNDLNEKSNLIIKYKNHKRDKYLLIGDTELDYRVAKKLHIPSVLLSNGIRSKKYLATFCKDALILDTLLQIAKSI